MRRAPVARSSTCRVSSEARDRMRSRWNSARARASSATRVSASASTRRSRTKRSIGQAPVSEGVYKATNPASAMACAMRHKSSELSGSNSAFGDHLSRRSGTFVGGRLVIASRAASWISVASVASPATVSWSAAPARSAPAFRAVAPWLLAILVPPDRTRPEQIYHGVLRADRRPFVVHRKFSVDDERRRVKPRRSR